MGRRPVRGTFFGGINYLGELTDLAQDCGGVRWLDFADCEWIGRESVRYFVPTLRV